MVYDSDGVRVTAFLVNHGDWREAYGYRFDSPGRSSDGAARITRLRCSWASWQPGHGPSSLSDVTEVGTGHFSPGRTGLAGTFTSEPARHHA